MNISLEKNTFIEAVNIVTRFAERKNTTLPVLSSVLIIANESDITFRATNLEIGIQFNAFGNVKTQGVVAIPAVVLQQLASVMSGDGSITLEQTGDTVTINTQGNKSVLKTVPYEDFPTISIPEEGEQSLTVSGVTVKQLISNIAPCASPSTIRPELASLLLELSSGMLTAVATDSFRLVEKKTPIKNTLQEKVLIPAKNALDIAHVIPDTEVRIRFTEHQLVLFTEHFTLTSRLTSATYPDYKQIIPKEKTTEVVVLRKDFEDAVRTTAIFADAFQKVTLSFDSKKNTVTLVTKNQETGSSQEIVPGKVTGESLSISCNYRFLQTLFTLCQSENLLITVTGIGRPLLFHGIGDNSLLYLISPMNQ